MVRKLLLTAVLVIFFSNAAMDFMCAYNCHHCFFSYYLACADDDETTYITMAFMVSFGWLMLHLAAQPSVRANMEPAFWGMISLGVRPSQTAPSTLSAWLVPN